MSKSKVCGVNAVRACWAASVGDGLVRGELAGFAADLDAVIAEALGAGSIESRALKLASLCSRMSGWLSACVGAPWLRFLFTGGEGMTNAEVWDRARAWVRADPSCIEPMVLDLTRRRPWSLIELAVAVDRVGAAAQVLRADPAWVAADGRLSLLAERSPALLVHRDGHQFGPIGMAMGVVCGQRSRLLAMLDRADEIDLTAFLLSGGTADPDRIAGGLWAMLTDDCAEQGLEGLDGAGYSALEDALARLSARASAELSPVVAEPETPAGFAECGDDPARIVACIVRDRLDSLIWFYVLLSKNAPMNQAGMGSAARALYDAEGPRWGRRPRPGARGPQTAERIAYLVSSGIVTQARPRSRPVADGAGEGTQVGPAQRDRGEPRWHVQARRSWSASLLAWLALPNSRPDAARPLSGLHRRNLAQRRRPVRVRPSWRISAMRPTSCSGSASRRPCEGAMPACPRSRPCVSARRRAQGVPALLPLVAVRQPVTTQSRVSWALARCQPSRADCLRTNPSRPSRRARSDQ